MTQSPVALTVFNRPYQTAETFAALRAQRPPRLLIIADGPRPDHPSDFERCAEVRAIVEQVDWPCEVSRDYAESNLGLKRRVSSGLDWVFSHVDRAVVLEDDCVAHPDFFRFCDELLERYADDERVWVVTGDNFQGERRRGKAAYYFSKYPHCWGWATWRRAWSHYQGDIPFWKEWRTSDAWRRIAPTQVERAYWEAIFGKVERQEIDSWAYPWTACVWYGGGLTATPNVNLVTNMQLRNRRHPYHRLGGAAWHACPAARTCHPPCPREAGPASGPVCLRAPLRRAQTVAVPQGPRLGRPGDAKGPAGHPVTIEVDTSLLSEADLRYLEPFLSGEGSLELEDIWALMDEAWDECGCDQKVMDERVTRFYRHPVWLLNGLFIEQHEASLANRRAFAAWVEGKAPKRVADFGGGYGTFAVLIGQACPGAEVEIAEPNPHPAAVALAAKAPNVPLRARTVRRVQRDPRDRRVRARARPPGPRGRDGRAPAPGGFVRDGQCLLARA